MQSLGNTRQSRNRGGWVKAMFRYTGGSNTCVRGDDGASGASANSCSGFLRAMTPGSVAGDWTITFPFTVNDRFVVVTPQWDGLHESIDLLEAFARDVKQPKAIVSDPP
jgi:hypothetical protein